MDVGEGIEAKRQSGQAGPAGACLLDLPPLVQVAVQAADIFVNYAVERGGAFGQFDPHLTDPGGVEDEGLLSEDGVGGGLLASGEFDPRCDLFGLIF